MRNIAFQVAYDGTDLCGSQWQSEGRSVQGELESAWLRLHNEQVRMTLAGRTDAGVHATGQVANTLTTSQRPLTTIVRAMNAILPADVAIVTAWEAPNQFHARFWAERRRYEYVIDNGMVASPLLRRTALAIARPLDSDAMHAAAQVLVGTHDFAAFTVGAPVGTTMRRCDEVTCLRTVRDRQPLVVVRLSANGFLRNMVRIMVGTLVLVGTGRLTAAGLHTILQGRNRQKAGLLAPAHGLTMVAVDYPASALRPDPSHEK
ncbi:MAG: tRNA pseudouridine(38-40) synthase TruA [Chloroflexia bacterium]|nr:tRNA pseudouridine(38-40) synthase TruA [Chloroflexia bacterium]